MTYINPVRDHDVWVGLRNLGIGGSDAGVLMRWNSYKGVGPLWEEKTGRRRSDFAMNRWIEWGNELEAPILDKYARHRMVPVLGRTTRGNACIFWPDERELEVLNDNHPLIHWLNPVVSPARSYARANVDGYSLDKTGKEITRYLEVKTTLQDNRSKWELDPPASYLAQCYHNAEVLRESGLHVPGEITVLVGGSDWGILGIPERPWLVDEMKEREARFWWCVESDTRPKVAKWFPRIPTPSEESDEAMVMAKQSGGGGPQIPPAPAGSIQGVCVDIVDRGERETEWQGKKKVVSKFSVHFLLPTKVIPEEIDGEPLPEAVAGKPYMVQKWFTNSLHENSAFRRFLKAWRGHDLTPEESAALNAGTLDLDSLVLGRNAILSISHSEKDDRTYANIDSAQSLMEGMTAFPIPEDWVRFEDRPPKGEEPAPAPASKGSDLPW